MNPADSGKYIADNSHHVRIHDDGIKILGEKILCSIKEGKLEIPDPGSNGIQPPKDHPRAVDWVFVTDALNFCFWSEDENNKWTVDGHSGYFALEAALFRAIKEGIDITNPDYYSKITIEQLKHILRGDTDIQIPLLEKRLEVLHEIGSILNQKHSGTFETCVKLANKSAVKLLDLVVEDFPCFRDEAVYKGQNVVLYKRAQILIADLWSFFKRSSWGEFVDVNKITMFADYRVPQVLVYFNVLSYSDDLMDKLERGIHLESGTEQEIEIRGCSIHAIELLKEEIQERIREMKSDIETPNSIEIDYYLWCYRRKYSEDLKSVPYHKTLGIYY